eukprot:jgi/Chrzof1/13908/Cz08g17020.t1
MKGMLKRWHSFRHQRRVWEDSCRRALHNEAEAARQQAALVAEQLRGQGTGMEIFDKAQKAAQRDRASAIRTASDPLLSHVTDRLLDRLEDCVAKFPTAVILGGAGEYVVEHLIGGRGGIERVIHMDTSPGMLELAKARQAEAREYSGKTIPQTEYKLADAEHLPLEPGSVDVIISCLGLHWANDLVGAMAQCQFALKPDGLFLAAMFGGETLQELRIACSTAQQEREGGISPFISPLAQVRDAGNLLTRAGFALPTVDVDTFSMRYDTAAQLVQHLRVMGESSALINKKAGLKRDTALAAAAAYEGMFAEEDGSVPATYQVMYMTGWSPAANQPKAAERGSATISFEEFAKEIEAKEQQQGVTEPKDTSA